MSLTEHEVLEEIASVFDEHSKHISQMKRLVIFAKGTRHSTLVNRMVFPMLYSHWEGFVNDVLTLYRDFICDQKLTFERIQVGLVALALRPYFAKFTNDTVFNTPGRVIKATTNIMRTISSPFDIVEKEKRKDIVGIVGMLNFKALNHLCEWFCIDPPQIDGKKLDTFVHKRNSVAHGGRPYDPDPSEALDWCDFIEECMEKFEYAVIEAIRKRKFLITA